MRFGWKKPTTDEIGDARRGNRQDLRVPARLILDGGTEYGVVIENLSTAGFRATMPAAIEIDRAFHVSLTRGSTREAKLVWRRGDVLGCQFVRPLTMVELLA